MRKTTLKRSLAILLALVMVLGALPLAAVATEVVEVDLPENITVPADWDVSEDGDDIILTSPDEDIVITVPEDGDIVISFPYDGSVTVPADSELEVTDEGVILVTVPDAEDSIAINLLENGSFLVQRPGEYSPELFSAGSVIVIDEDGDIVAADFVITVEVDEDHNVTVTVNPEDEDIEVSLDENGNIVITLPADEDAEDELDLTVFTNLPEGWAYTVAEDEDGNVIITITPPAGHRVIVDPDDEDEENWILVEVHEAYMFGNRRGEFLPSADITRAEVAAILVRTKVADFVEGELPDGMEEFDEFSDVGEDNWFYYYVAWAYSEGLVQGDGRGRFLPRDQITREQLAAMLSRTIEYEEEAGEMPFTDVEDISGWADNYVYTAFNEGWMIGDARNRFRPGANIMRAEVATAVNRILNRISNNDALGVVENIDDAREFPDVDADATPARWYFASVVGATNDFYQTRDTDDDDALFVDWMYILQAADADDEDCDDCEEEDA